MTEIVRLSTEQVLNILLKALHDAQMQALAYKTEAERLRAEVERLRSDGGAA